MYWLFLILSVVFEVIGTSIMKAFAESSPLVGVLIMYFMIALSYFTLSKAVLKLPVGVAYAFWEGAGLVLITLSSLLFLGEEFGLMKGAALCLVLTGTYLVHRGTGHGEGEE